MEIVLLRHRKTKGNLEGRYVGSTDEPILLSEAGEERIQIHDFWPEKVFTSQLLRTVQSAESFFPGVLIETNRMFEEMDFGEFEYKNYRELQGNQDYQRYIDSNGTIAFPKGESREQMQKRCIEAFFQCVEKSKSEGRRAIAFVVHGGTIMSIMNGLYPDSPFFEFQVSCGCGYRIKIEEKKETEENLHEDEIKTDWTFIGTGSSNCMGN
ncbi:MAG: histidine phosphatase family protein [Lachnospiraceae bacterium]